MLVIDKLLAKGLFFVLDRVAEIADREQDDVEQLREELLATQMKLELGEIDEAEFEAREADVLARLREARAHTGGRVAGVPGRFTVESIDAEAGPPAPPPTRTRGRKRASSARRRR